MGKRAMQFRGEHKLRIDRDLTHPKLGQFGLDVPVKRGIDLDHIETLRQKFQRMALPALHARRIKDAVPIFIAPTGRTDANLRECVHGSRKVTELKVSTAKAAARETARGLRKPASATGCHGSERKRVYDKRRESRSLP